MARALASRIWTYSDERVWKMGEVCFSEPQRVNWPAGTGREVELGEVVGTGVVSGGGNASARRVAVVVGMCRCLPAALRLPAASRPLRQARRLLGQAKLGRPCASAKFLLVQICEGLWSTPPQPPPSRWAQAA